MAVLSRAWQISAKGVEEVRDSQRPLAAADMVLVRLAYAADLPTPGRSAEAGWGRAPADAPAPAASRASRAARRRSVFAAARRAARCAPAARARGFARAGPGARPARRDRRSSRRWSRWPTKSATSSSRSRWSATCGWCGSSRAGSNSRSRRAASPQLAPTLTQRLQDWTGQRWMVALVASGGAPTPDGTGARPRSASALAAGGRSAGAPRARALSRRGDRRRARQARWRPAPIARRRRTRI